MNILVFDIETVPDIHSGARLLGIDPADQALSAADLSQAMQSQSKESTGQGFVKHHLQQIVAISVLLRQGERFKLWSLGEPGDAEAVLIQRFFAGVEKYVPTLVSWNGGQFDLPVLHYRALLHGVVAPLYWETGEQQASFKYNNYLNRYHQRHLDLMDCLAAYNQKAYVRLDEMAQMLGLPGKMGLSGHQVLDQYLAGQIQAIRDYCETDVLNTYLIYLRFQLIRGILSQSAYEAELQFTQDYLAASAAPHLLEFLAVWQQKDDDNK